MDIYFQQTAQPMVIYFTGGFNFNSYIVGGGGLVADGNYGDITVNGAGSNWFINTGVVESGNLAARNVTFDKLPEIGSYKFLGRHSDTAGDIQEIGIDGGLEFHGGNLRRSALTGVVTASAGSNITALATGVVSSVNLGGDITQAGLNLITGLNSIVQREFLGLGSAAIANTGDFAAFLHTHPLSGIDQSGATTGQVAQWNGTHWAPATPSAGSSVMTPRCNVSTTSGSTTASIPFDNTIPQITEGGEIISLANVTPTNASSKILVQFSTFCVASTSNPMPFALFNGSTNAVASTVTTVNTTMVCISWLIDSWVGAKTLSVRAGPPVGTLYWLRTAAEEKFSTARQSVITATEIPAP